MRPWCVSRISRLMIILICYTLLPNSPARGAFLYKNYVVRTYAGSEYLCEPYLVRRDDYVWKIFRRKGEIAHRDLPHFVTILKHLNPHVTDIDTIVPGQVLYIPLRKLGPHALPGQASGVVTIPYVTVSTPPDSASPDSVNTDSNLAGSNPPDSALSDRITPYTKPYIVQPGDYVSKLVAADFGPIGTRDYREGLTLFQLANPGIDDLNLIRAGETIKRVLPDVINRPWYRDLLARLPAPLVSRIRPTRPAPTRPRASHGEAQIQPKKPLPLAPHFVKELAGSLNARLLDRGTYFFPGPGSQELALDLTLNPMVIIGPGQRILFARSPLSPSQQNQIKALYPQLRIIDLPPRPDQVTTEPFFHRLTAPQSVSIQGIQWHINSEWIWKLPARKNGRDRFLCMETLKSATHRTPPTLVRYLARHGIEVHEVVAADQTDSGTSNHMPIGGGKPDVEEQNVTGEALVRGVVETLGYTYSPKASISFPYAGIHITARSNMVSGANRQPFFIDFGELHGGAAAAIQTAGFRLLQLYPAAAAAEILPPLFEFLELKYTTGPSFATTTESATHHLQFTLPGYLISTGDGPKLLVARVPLAKAVRELIASRGIKCISVKSTLDISEIS